MNDQHVGRIAQELSLKPQQVRAAANLLDEGGTVPFIARYRKEATGMLDEVAVTAIRDRLGQLHERDERRAAILKSLEERKLLTDELRGKVDAADTMAALEDETLGCFINLRSPWSFLPASPFAARSRRERECETKGTKIWRLAYRLGE